MVQGVGFRPFAFRLATQLDLSGFVRNDADGVHIEVEGSPAALATFARELKAQAPAPARLAALDVLTIPLRGELGFRIEASTEGEAVQIVIPADSAPCPNCLAELFDPSDRRHGYPFLNCAHCGPRLTVVRAMPYDRARTTLAGFGMCAACRREYEDPSDRRFHAEPTACPRCGPRLALLAADRAVTDQPLEAAARALKDGRILAVKGVGGFHLACDARNRSAVSTLRERKAREEKPFAVMVADLAAAERLCRLPPGAADALASPARPILLLEARPDAPVAREVAPEGRLLGVMLPSTPLHCLLLAAFDGPLVMTSGNRSDEPIAYTDEDARERLGPLADLTLTHDRPIHIRCDDSVLRWTEVGPLPIRRSRGYAPLPLQLPVALDRPTLATGGMLKAAFALGTGAGAVLSHHLGDLDQAEAYQSFEEAVAHYERLYRTRPARLVHDLHPDYPSTRWAQSRAAAEGLELLGVQHHHAHFASALIDARLSGPALGVVFDGTGYGLDGGSWGGEIFIGDAAGVERAASLSPAPLPGGDRSAREPWRCALARLGAAGLPVRRVEQRIGAARARAMGQVIRSSVFAPLSSSVGRLFDAVAWLVGGPDQQTFEGQMGIRVEALAASTPACGAYPFAVREFEQRLVFDPAPALGALLEDLDRGLSPAQIARRFHQGLAEATAAVCGALSERTGLSDVVLTGGVFQNALLSGSTCDALRALGLTPHVHRAVPPNDGGLALGQLAVAAARAPGGRN